MKALILGAGQGKRLLPLTADQPKSLLKVGGNSLIAWQVRELVKCGVDEIVVVVGFGGQLLKDALRSLGQDYPECEICAIDNPHYATTDNLVSCWVARGEMDRDFVLLNGDTLFESPVLERLLESPPAPVTLVIDHKAHYDDDDMKVRLDGLRLVEIGKTIAADRIDGESIGMMLFRGEGPGLFAAALDRAMNDAEAGTQWYLSVIDELSRRAGVQTRSTGGHEWCEVDYPLDLLRARRLVAHWQEDRAGDEVSLAVP